MKDRMRLEIIDMRAGTGAARTKYVNELQRCCGQKCCCSGSSSSGRTERERELLRDRRSRDKEERGGVLSDSRSRNERGRHILRLIAF